MKSTFKVDKLGRINPTEDERLNKLSSKRISLKPKSMTRSKSLKPFVVINQVATTVKTQK